MTKPQKVFRIGAISASVFKNEAEDGPFHSITLQRRYKDDDEWKTSHSFTTSQAPAAIAVFQKALDYVLEQGDEGNE